MCHGSGFLAVYTIGLIMGHYDFMHKKSFIKFAKGLEWFMQIGMFVALGLLVDPAKLLAIMPLGLLLSLVLILVARPVSVFISLLFSRFGFREKCFVSWVGLRGAVPIVFATYLYELPDKAKASSMFHLIFVVVIVSILLQGTMLYPLAKWLRLENKRAITQKHKQILQLSDDVKKMFMQMEVPVGSPAHGLSLVELGLPKPTLIVLIYRDNRYFTPQGNTPVRELDKLYVMVDSKKELKEVNKCLGIPI